MKILLDTNVLLRHTASNDPLHGLCRRACRMLVDDGGVLVLVPQVFYEFYVVATRPRDQNGWAMSPRDAVAKIDELREMFAVYADPPSVFDMWRELVQKHEVRGKRAHDARLAAAMMQHEIETILTLNGDDFRGLAGVKALDPRTIIAAS